MEEFRTHHGPQRSRYLSFLYVFLAVFVIQVQSGLSQEPTNKEKRQITFGFGIPNNRPAQHNPHAAGQALGHAIGGTVNNLLGGLLFGNNANNRPQGCNVNNGGCQQGCLVRRGRRQCYCNVGFVLNQDQVTCSDIDECNLVGEQPCQDKCTNTVGSYQCSCGGGATLLQDGRSCREVGLSCANNNGGCEQICKEKNNGSIKCKCQKGYVLNPDERTCADVDECSSGDHNCNSNQECKNLVGGFECMSARVEEALSCSVNNGGCDHRCKQKRGGRIRCGCRRGFRLSSDRKTCNRIEGGCADNKGGCEHRCRDTRNGSRCLCRKGFELQQDGKSCGDIDECSLGLHDCPDICLNKPGSFRCTTQRDQAGCSLNNGGCEQRCRETRKGVKCGCRRKFKLQEDRRSCLPKGQESPNEPPLDECAEDNGGCDQLCINNDGEATCECNPGFVLVNGLCQRSIVPPNSSPIQSTPPSPIPQTQECGVNTKKSLFRRIVGGKPADPKDWPWMAAILRNQGNQQFCGGTLITDRHILTAAHCVIQFTKDDIKVRLGEYNFDSPDENNPTDFRVEEILMHANYSQQTQENDIAILKLGRPSSFSEFIWPVCLPPPNNEFEDQLGYVTGWGTIHFGGPVSKVLQEVVIPVWKQSDCVAAYPENKVTDSMMCAGLKAGGKDSCQGDSGGPFLVQIFPETRWYIAGVVSWGIECASPNRPGVYTRVNMYLDWIQKNARF